MLSWIDWLIALVPFTIILGIAFSLRRYVTSVAHFLTGGRLAGRYLICVASGEASMGVVSAVAWFEIFGKSGLSNNLWNSLFYPIITILGLLGFVIYRFRETRAMTLAQFFEMRYSRRFRLFAGGLIFLAGILNYGIFPGIAARFFVSYIGLPPMISLGPVMAPTYIAVMALLLFGIVLIAVTGGQTTIMTVDCLGGLFAGISYLVIIAALFYLVPWSTVGDLLKSGGPGKSLVDPFDNYKLTDFSLWYVLLGTLISAYSFRAWQGYQGYGAAALNAHEAKMGGILGQWRNMGLYLMYGMMAACGLVVLTQPHFSAMAGDIHAELSQFDNSTIRNQMEVPIALRHLLPEGPRGLFLVIMLFSMIATDSAMLHSWGSVFIQDVLLPLTGEKHLTPAQHLRWLRRSIIGVAIFAFLFSALVQVTDYVFMFQQITMAVYLAGAGAVIIGGLYWKRGTAQGAWTALALGAVLALSSIVLQQLWVRDHAGLQQWFSPSSPIGQLLSRYPERFPINGQVMSFSCMALALASYVVVSLLTCRQPFPLDRMLHRGKYAEREPEDVAATPFAPAQSHIGAFRKILGINETYTRNDRLIAYSVFGWNFLWLTVSLLLLLLHFSGIRWSRETWFLYGSTAYYFIPAGLAILTTIWFTWGGMRDFLRYLKALKLYKPDLADDGTIHPSGKEFAAKKNLVSK